MRTIAIQYSDAGGFEPEKNFTLCIGDRLNRGKKAEMGGLDGSDYANVGPRQSSETGYFARMVHAQLENAISNIWRHPGEREWQTPMIVEAAGGGESRAACSEGQAQRFFGASLADTARNRDEPGAAAFARSSAKSSQARECVSNPKQRRSRQTGYLVVHHCCDGATLERRTDEVMAVVIGSPQRDKQVAVGQASCINRYPASGPIYGTRSAGRSRSIARIPK
jgi:hypothetical protein